jgi:16S rRNA (guanine527-N7)-methyltransferase
MHPDRIAELLAPFLGESFESADRASAVDKPFALSPAQLGSISTYIDILFHWNSRINLTSVRLPEEIVTRHFGESLFAARHLVPIPSSARPELLGAAASPPGSPGVHVIDVGSGAGFPGLPIKIWDPDIRLTLIESNHKKATFLSEVVRALTFTNVDVFTGRASDFQESNLQESENKSKQVGDVVTLRAVEHFDLVLPEAARMVGPSGCLAILIGEAQLDRARKLAPSLQWDAPVKLPRSSSRFLIKGRNESKE